MESLPSVEDLRLVHAIARLGSLGAAARELLISQPSASQRLAALERRCGMVLFDRDTTGARPTAAGRAMAHEAAHIIDHLSSVFDHSREAADHQVLRVGTFSSLAPLLFPALDQLIPEVSVFQVSGHGDHLVPMVGNGALDAAVVALADQVPLPQGVTSIPIARDDLVLLHTPDASPLGSGKRPWAGHVVPFHVLDFGGEALHARIIALGGTPRRCTTGDTALALARAHGGHALVVRAFAERLRHTDESIEPSPVRRRYTLSLVTRTPVPDALSVLRTGLAAAMSMQPVT